MPADLFNAGSYRRTNMKQYEVMCSKVMHYCNPITFVCTPVQQSKHRHGQNLQLSSR